MITLFNYIKNIFNSYSSFLDFYIKELNIYVSIFEVINCLILLFIFFFLFIRFIIIRYTLKKVIFFIFKRIIFAFIVFIFLSFISNPIYCENSVISKLFDTNTKKICIATLAITGCYLSYKYIPIYYKTVISHNNYIEYLKQKETYNIQYKEYEIYVEFLNKHKKQVTDYNSNVKIFDNVIDHLLNCFDTFTENKKFKFLFKNKQLFVYNLWLNQFQCKVNGDNSLEIDLNKKISQISKNLNNSKDIIDNLGSDFHFEIKNSNNISIHNKCFNDLNILVKFYNEKLIPKFILLNGDSKTLDLMVSNKSIYLDLLNEANILLNKAIYSSDLLVSTCNNIKNGKLLLEPESLITLEFIELQKPKIIEPIDFPLENLEGFRYIGINVGYVVFYPVLYSSNKILGTCNPLSSQSFVDAISYLISLIKFF